MEVFTSLQGIQIQKRLKELVVVDQGEEELLKTQLGEGTRTQQEDNRKRGQEVRNSEGVRHIN